MQGCFTTWNKTLVHIQLSCVKKYVYPLVYIVCLVVFDDIEACDPSMLADGIIQRAWSK